MWEPAAKLAPLLKQTAEVIAILFTSVEMRQIDQEIGHYANLQIHPGVDMLSLSLSLDRRGGETYGSDKPATQRNNEGMLLLR